MCCDPIPACPEDKATTCPECDGDVDEEGWTVEECCTYSPEVCKVCHWSPCDQSC